MPDGDKPDPNNLIWDQPQSATPAASARQTPDPANLIWDKPAAGQTPQPDQPVTLGEMGRVGARGLIKGATDIATFIPDIAVQAEHAIDPALQKLSDWSGLPMGEPLKSPTQYAREQLDRWIKPSEHKWGQRTEEGIALLASGGLSGVAERAAVKAPQIAEKIAERATATPATARAAQNAVSEGYKISPAYIGGGAERQVAEWYGRPHLFEDNSALNEFKTDEIARRDLGLHPDEELGPSTYDRLKKAEYQTFEEARALTPKPTDELRASPQFLQDMANANRRPGGSPYISGTHSFGPPEYESVTAPIIAKYNKPSFNIGESLDRMRELRASSRANLANYDPEKNAIGYTQRKVADAMESEIARMAERPIPAQEGAVLDPVWGGWKGTPTHPSPPQAIPGLGQRLREARTQLAKIQNYEDATRAGGHVSATDFARLLRNDPRYPLSGGARTIAETALNFPKDMQSIAGAGKGERGAFSVVDYMMGGVGLAAHHPAVAAISLTRPVLGKAVRSEAVQERMLKGYTKRATREPPSELRKGIGKTATGVRKAAVRGAIIRKSEDDQPPQPSLSDMD
jgi:hypothetical protein